MGWLEGKRALVVGAGSGIGRAVLAAFRSEGAQVAALELDEAKAERLAAELPGCVVSQGDATSLADARAAVRAVTHAFGGLDVLVNCVGIFDFYRGLADIADDQLDAAFDEVFAVNVKSQLVCVRAALPELRRRRVGRADGLHLRLLPGSRRHPLRGVEVRRPRLRDRAGPRTGPGGARQRRGAGRNAGHRTHRRRASAWPIRSWTRAAGREEDLRRGTRLQVALTGADHAGSYVFLASDRARGITGTVVHSDGGVGVK